VTLKGEKKMTKRSLIGSPARRRAALLTLAVGSSVGLFERSTCGAIRSWLSDGTKSYETAANWSGAVVPVAADSAEFDMGGFIGFSGAHTVTFSTAHSISSVNVLRDDVTFSLGLTTYSLTSASPLSLSISDDPSDIGSNFARVTLQNGTLASAGGTWIGVNTDEAGTLLISTGGVGTFAGEAVVGNGGSGSLIMQSGGDFIASQCSLASGSNGTGNVIVNGTGSTFRTTGANGCLVGEFGNGTVALIAGASATTNGVAIGSALFGVSGAGTVSIASSSTWNNTGAFRIGALGAGTLIMGTGTLTSTTSTLSGGPDATGVALIGSGANWINTSTLTVGSAGEGSVLVTSGGRVSANGITLGDSPGSQGTVTVYGNTASLTSSAGMTIGNFGDGTFSVLAGGKASSAASVLIGNVGHGLAVVDGPTSAWTVGGFLVVAAGGGGSVGSLSITNGGTVSSVGASVGTGVGSSASVLVAGAGAAWTCTGAFDLGGFSGTAGAASDLTIAPAATLAVSSPNTLRIYTPGALHLNGGTLSVGSLVIDPGGVLDFASGTLAVTGIAGLRLGATGPLGATFDATSGRSLVAGTLNLDAGAILRMSSGTVSASTLNNSGRIVLSDVLSTLTASVFNNNGLIDGDGVIAASLRNNASGEVRADAGKRVHFAEPTFGSFNDGQINLFGGEIEFNQQLANHVTGRITGRGTIIGHADLANSGTISLSGGLSDINVPLTNQLGSKVIITGGSTSTFFQTVTNQSGSEFRVSTNSTAVFLGNVTGLAQFTGPGVKDFEAGASPGPLVTAGSSIVGPSASLSATTIRENALTVEGHVALQPNGTATATNRLGSLAIDGVTDAWSGSLDLADNDLILDYSGGSPVAAVLNQIKTGFNHGAWNGNGISSSLADASAHGLGIADNTTLGLTSFSGQAVDPTSVLIKYTFFGDSNLDGQVDVTDLGALATHWQTASSWTGGDFNYDGFVDVSDLGALATNWQAGVGSPLAPGSLEAALAAVGLGGTAVPEPESLFLASLVLLTAGAVRRRV
jgi:T5SS/PEP-CTERM-associated repeat protein